MTTALAAYLALLSPPAATIEATFSGEYEMKLESLRFTLSLDERADAVTGTLKIGADTYRLTGKVDGKGEPRKASGKYKSEDEDGEFRLELAGDRLTFIDPAIADDGTVQWDRAERLAFVRVGKNPAAAPAATGGKIGARVGKADPTAAAEGNAQTAAILKNGKTYEHASGGKFRYPANWQLRETEEGLELLPPDKGGESIFIAAESAAGKTDPNDPEVLMYLDSIVQAYYPGARREGKPKPARAGTGKAVELVWNAGDKRIRALTAIIKNHGVTLGIVGSRAEVDRRAPQLDEIFLTFGWGQGKVDRQLVGTWAYFSYSQVSGRSTNSTAVLNADGTFSFRSNSEAASNLSGKDGLGNQTWTGWVNSRSTSANGGTWTADGKTLWLHFSDGSTEEFDYRFEQQGSAFVVKLFGNDPNKPMEWAKQG